MSTDTALIEKREGLKRRLAAGEYKTLVDVMLDGTSQVIQKVTRNPRQISPWYSSMVLYLVVQLVLFTLIVIIGDITTFFEFNGDVAIVILSNIVIVNLAIGYLFVPGIVINNFFIHYVFKIFRDDVLELTESIEDVEDFERWLNQICNRKAHLVVSIVVGVLTGIFLMYINSVWMRLSLLDIENFDAPYILLSIGNFMFLYMIIYMVILSARIGQYHLKLYSADPGSSEVITRIARLLNNFMYLVAIYTAFLALVISSNEAVFYSLEPAAGLTLLLFWMPIIALFALNQNSLTSIVKRSKWKTLNEIQLRVEKLHTPESFENQETMDTIKRLMDYHDRVKATRDSVLDFRAYLSFFNSLLLPLLAFILGNLELVLKFFGRNP